MVDAQNPLGLGGLGAIAQADLRGMDLETALMAVQANRANALERSLMDQMTAVQNKNQQISALNQLLGAMNAAAAKVDPGAKAGDPAKISAADGQAIADAAKAANITLPPEMQCTPQFKVTYADGHTSVVDQAGLDAAKKQSDAIKSAPVPPKELNFGIFGMKMPNPAYMAHMAALKNQSVTGSSPTDPKPPTANKGQLDAAVQQLKSTIDSLSNSQQMDMLRLQSLSNKRNEAFEIMTNFVKKMSDSRSSIVGNMR